MFCIACAAISARLAIPGSVRRAAGVAQIDDNDPLSLGDLDRGLLEERRTEADPGAVAEA